MLLVVECKSRAATFTLDPTSIHSLVLYLISFLYFASGMHVDHLFHQSTVKKDHHKALPNLPSSPALLVEEISASKTLETAKALESTSTFAAKAKDDLWMLTTSPASMVCYNLHWLYTQVS